MRLEWSDEALADLDRFAEFLHRDHPALAAIFATEIVDKVQVLSEHPLLGRRSPAGKNIVRWYCRCLARSTCFSIASMVGAL
jgi:plasmid stabilization system protein ParE